MPTGRKLGIQQTRSRINKLQGQVADIVAELPNGLSKKIFETDTDFSELEANDRSAARELVRRYRNCLVRLIQLLAICEDTYKCRRMARQYPWKSNYISRSDHLYFVWFSFTNHCYLYRERAKLFSNDFNSLYGIFNFETIPVSAALKTIDSALGDHIRHRGQHVHEYHSDHSSYKSLSLAELATALGLQERLKIDPKSEFRSSKWYMGYLIDQSLDFMLSNFESQFAPRASDLILAGSKIDAAFLRARKEQQS